MIGPGRCGCCEFRDEGERWKGRAFLLRCDDMVDWDPGSDRGRDGGEVREDEDEDENDGFRSCDVDNRRGC